MSKSKLQKLNVQQLRRIAEGHMTIAIPSDYTKQDIIDEIAVEFEVQIGSSSEDIRLRKKFFVK